VPTARDFVPWRFSDAGHSARGWHRHAGVRETLYGALEVKRKFHGMLFFPSTQFLCST
jgi:hypothetical protein